MGKKKTADVQFYAEVMDSVQTIEGARRSMYDPDELEEEQREREIRNRVRAARVRVFRCRVLEVSGGGGL